MTPAKSDPRPLGLLGALMLGLGLGLRFLLPDEPSSSPLEGALVRIPLLSGAAIILLERLIRRGPAPSAVVWLIPLAILPGCFPLTAIGVTRAMDLVAAVCAGIALRDLVVHDRFGATLCRWLLALGLALCLIGLAQALWQRDELREAVGTAWDASPMARAFLDSNRATSTLVNANAFAGLLLLLLPLAIGGRGSRSGRGVLIVLLATLATTGSAGAILALLLALGVRWRAPDTHGRWCRAGFIGGAAGVLLLVTALATSWQPPLVGDKIETFRQRLDYHALGARMLADAGPLGAGIEATQELRWAHARPDEGHSDYIHDTWLQLLIEIGPVGMLLAASGVGLLAYRRRTKTPAPEQDRPTEHGSRAAVAFGIGVTVGVTMAPLLNGVPRVLPLGWAAPPILDALGLAGCVLLSARMLRNVIPPSGAAWTWGIVAFALHGLVDYDLYVPAAATMLGAACALAPIKPAQTRSMDRPLLAVAGLVLLTLPLVVGLVGLARDNARLAINAVRRGDAVEEHLRTIEDLATSLPDPVALEGLSRHPARFTRALDALPPSMRTWPIYRRIEAEHLARRRFLGERHDMAHLLHPGEAMEPWIRRSMMRVAMVDGDTASRRTHARAGLDAMKRFAIRDPVLLEDLQEGAR